MKQLKNIILIALFFVASVISVVTLGGCSKKELYSYREANGGYYISVNDKNAISGDVVIPTEYKGKPVLGIDDSGFVSCFGITSITIPEGITSIGYKAFQNCKCPVFYLPASLTTMGSKYGEDITFDISYGYKFTIHYAGGFLAFQNLHTSITEGSILHCTNGDYIKGSNSWEKYE